MGFSRQGMGKAALLLVIGTALSRVLGIVRETAIAYQFGATAQTDAYLVALIVPMAISSIVVGALATAFIPVFTEHRLRDGEQEAWTMGNAVINLAALILLIAAVLYFLAAPFFIALFAPGLAPETEKLAVDLSRLLSSAIIFNGLIGIANALLRSYRHFTYPAFAGLLHNLGMIGGTLFLGGMLGISGLAIGVLVGLAANLLILFVPLSHQKKLYQPTLRGLRHPGTKKIGLLLLPIIIGSAAGQINLLVDRSLASGLTEGSISALNFADRLVGLPLGIFVASATTAAYPFLAEQAALKNMHELRRIFSEGLRMLWFIVFPLVAGLLILDEPIVRLLFERGAFDAAASELTSVALFYYSLGIIAHAASAMLSSVYFALQDTATPIKLGLFSVGLNIVLNFILVGYMAHAGLALATSIAGTVTCILLAYSLRRRLGHLDGQRLLRSVAKIAAASLLMGIAVSVAYGYTAAFFDTTIFVHQLLQVGGLIVLGGAVYFVSAALLRTEELTWLSRRVREKLLPSKTG